MHRSTKAIHVDQVEEPVGNRGVASPIHVSTTYEVNDLRGIEKPLVYSRTDTTLRRRAETLIGALEIVDENGKPGHCVMYSSGQAASFSLLFYLRPKRVAIEGGYHGTHENLHFLQEFVQHYEKNACFEVIPLETAPLRKGDVVWLESPRNPDCKIFDIKQWAKKVHEAGALLVIDSTFATPVLCNPFLYGADFVMHSTTKFLNGHSDGLAGVIITKDADEAEKLRSIRNAMGNVPGNLEVWLLLRSLRTLELRVERQSQTATIVAKWLSEQTQFVKKVLHPSLCEQQQKLLGEKNQMKSGGGVFAVETTTPHVAERLPQVLQLIKNATSLGGVESLIDWRYKWDKGLSPCLLRVSIGLEHPKDLIKDFDNAFQVIEGTSRL